MPPSWQESPETRIAQQVIAEDVRGGLPVVNTSQSVAVPQAKMVASMTVASFGTAAVPVALPVLVVPILFWVARAMGVGSAILGAAGIITGILDLFAFGRIFIYYKGEEIGSMPPEVAWTWFYELRANVQRNVRLRMEGADKGGFSGAIPPYRGYGSGEDWGDGGKSLWDKINPFDPQDSLGDKLNPFVGGNFGEEEYYV